MQPAQRRQSYSHRMRSAICRAREIVALQAGKFFNRHSAIDATDCIYTTHVIHRPHGTQLSLAGVSKSK